MNIERSFFDFISVKKSLIDEQRLKKVLPSKV